MLENNHLSVVNIQGIRGYIDEKGRAWLNLEDVSKGLGFTEVKRNRVVAESGDNYQTVRWNRVYQYLKELEYRLNDSKDTYQSRCPEYIPEEIFYRLAMKANNSVASDFQNKIATEILPQLRKTGIYMTLKAKEEILFNPDLIISLATEVKESRKLIAEMKPKVDYYDTVIDSSGAISLKITAKVLDLVKFSDDERTISERLGRNNFMNVLRELDILDNENIPKQRFMNQGLFIVKQVYIRGRNEFVSVTYVTSKGLDYLLKVFQKAGYIPKAKINWKNKYFIKGFNQIIEEAQLEEQGFLEK